MPEYELDESLEPKGFGSAVVAIAVGVCFGGTRIVARDGLTSKTVLVLVIAAVVCVLLMLPFLALAKKARLHVTAEGVTTRSITGKENTLAWADVRTAALIRINKRDNMRVIVLSPKAPQEALKNRRAVMKDGKNGEMHLIFTEERRLAVEHWLNKELPFFDM